MSEFRPGEAVAAAETRIPVQRILGLNPSPMTGPGTNTYLVGEHRLALIDPGPADEAQFENFMAILDGRPLEWILTTHTHGDHSPGARRLKQATGAKLIGLPAPESGSHDREYQPDGEWHHGDRLDCGEYTIEIIHTPGHVSNHFCYLIEEEQLLFTGDHILQGTTSVILPPDGNMSEYLSSLRALQGRELKFLAPGHGLVMDDPQAEIEKLVRHRMQREHKIFARLQTLGSADLDKLVVQAYDDVAEHLLPWAKKTMLAHLLKLEQDGRAVWEAQESSDDPANGVWRCPEAANV